MYIQAKWHLCKISTERPGNGRFCVLEKSNVVDVNITELNEYAKDFLTKVFFQLLNGEQAMWEIYETSPVFYKSKILKSGKVEKTDTGELISIEGDVVI